MSSLKADFRRIARAHPPRARARSCELRADLLPRLSARSNPRGEAADARLGGQAASRGMGRAHLLHRRTDLVAAQRRPVLVALRDGRQIRTDGLAANEQGLADILVADNALLKRLEDEPAPLEGKQNALLLVTDLEALHPFLRIGAIESQLQGKFHVPTDVSIPRRAHRQDAPEVSRLLPGRRQLPLRPRRRLSQYAKKNPGITP
jgi:hypothetical protein